MKRADVAQIALGVLLVSLFARAAAMFEPFPGWDGDPLAGYSAITGLGPTAGLFLDVATVIAATLVMVSGRGSMNWLACLGVAGCLAVIARTLLFDRDDTEPLPVAGAWASGAFAFAAACCIARRPALLRFATAVVLGFLCVLLAKGAGQLLFEHPAVVASFELNPETTLASRGFEPGSAAALQFERRLRQPDITAWFGLSNVLAAWLVAGALGSGLLCWCRRSQWKRPAWLVALALAVCCVAGVLATGSKAGLAVLTSGGLVLVAARLGGVRIGLIAGLGLWLLPIVAVIGRGAIGSASGELSLLVRWFYLSTATEIGLDRLPWGTGIDGFRAAYAVAKPAIATETVTSSHNAMADWFAMLGVAGVPFVLVAGGSALANARAIGARVGGVAGQLPVRPTTLGIGLVLALPVTLSAWLEAEATPIELAAVRLAGLGCAIGAACCVFALRPTRVVPAIAGLALLTHAQLDMVLFQPGSIPLAMLCLGLGCGSTRRMAGGRWVAAVSGLAAAGLLCVLTLRVQAWESPLRRGFSAAQDVVALRERAIELGGLPPEQRALIGPRLAEAAGCLEEAAEAMPSDPRALLSLAELRVRALDDAAGALDAARRAVDAERSSRTLGRLGLVAASAGETDEAREAWIDAAALDPHSPHFPGLIAVLLSEQGQAGDARRWAEEALARDGRFSLDPLAGLPADRREKLEDLAKADGGGS